MRITSKGQVTIPIDIRERAGLLPKDLSAFEREARREAAPASLKSFAASTLKGLQDHLKMAQDLSGKLGTGASSPGSPGSLQRR